MTKILILCLLLPSARARGPPCVQRELRGSQGMGVVSTTGLIVFYSQFFTCSTPHADPLLGTPLVPLKV